MSSELYTDMFHLERNIYCNDEMVICRLFKLIIVFLRSQNAFVFYLLKRTKESNISNSILTLMTMDNPEPILQKLIGDKLPEPLSCSVEEYDVKLIPQALGCYDILITYETKQTLASKNVLENKPCIVYLNDFIDKKPLEFFQLLVSGKSSNKFACENLFRQYINIGAVMPRQYVLLLSLNSLRKNVHFLSENTVHNLTIHLIKSDKSFNPKIPSMNCILVYLNADSHLAEPLLPVISTDNSYIQVKKVETLQNMFKS